MKDIRVGWNNYQKAYIITILIWVNFLYNSILSYFIIGFLIIGFFMETIQPEIDLILGKKISRYRKPKLLRICYILAFHRLLYYIVNPISVCFALLAINYTEFNVTSIIAIGVAYFTAKVFVVSSLLTLIKTFLVGETKIIVFRRFNTDDNHNNVVLPIASSFGQTIIFHDNTFFQAKTDFFTMWKYTQAGMNNRIITDDSRWKEKLEKLIVITDYVVFDWQDTPTANMLFEFHEAAKHINQNRMIWFIPTGKIQLIQSQIIEMGFKEKMNIIDRNWSYLKQARGFYNYMKYSEPKNRIDFNWK